MSAVRQSHRRVMFLFVTLCHAVMSCTNRLIVENMVSELFTKHTTTETEHKFGRQ